MWPLGQYRFLDVERVYVWSPMRRSSRRLLALLEQDGLMEYCDVDARAASLYCAKGDICGFIGALRRALRSRRCLASIVRARRS
jgi:hypothetical protein